jgi:hypothetical protein
VGACAWRDSFRECMVLDDAHTTARGSARADPACLSASGPNRPRRRRRCECVCVWRVTGDTILCGAQHVSQVCARFTARPLPEGFYAGVHREDDAAVAQISGVSWCGVRRKRRRDADVWPTSSHTHRQMGQTARKTERHTDTQTDSQRTAQRRRVLRPDGGPGHISGGLAYVIAAPVLSQPRRRFQHGKTGARLCGRLFGAAWSRGGGRGCGREPCT